MPLSLRTIHPALTAVIVAFALTAAVLFAFGRGSSHTPDPAAARRALPSQPKPGATTEQRIATYQAIVRARPLVPAGYTLLAASELQRVRETGDAGSYVRAAGVLQRGLAIAPADPGLLTERGALELSRHDFRAGLRDGRAAHSAAPTLTRPYGVIVDGLVELGRYGEAERVLQQMVDRKPDLASYSRVSYLRELHGDIPGAQSALRLAVSAGGESAENVAYVQTLLGNLELASGHQVAARRAYREALFHFASYVPAQAGLGRADAAAGHTGAAIRRLRAAVSVLPLPEYVIALGDVELAAGRAAAARRDYALVGAEQRLLAAGGVNTDVDIALFEADHGSPARAMRLGRRAWAAAPSVRSADALGWALTAAGHPRQGLVWARRALKLGSRDALFLYHAGMTARAAGRPDLARTWIGAALARNPRFSVLYAPRARRALKGLS